MNATDLASQIETTIREIFPKSFVEATFSTGIFPCIAIYFTVGHDKSQWINGYFENDMATVQFFVQSKGLKPIPRDGELDDIELELEKKTGSYLIRPQVEHYVYSSVKVPFRRVRGDASKILNGIQMYFLRFKQSLIESRNANLLTDEHMQLVGANF